MMEKKSQRLQNDIHSHTIDEKNDFLQLVYAKSNQNMISWIGENIEFIKDNLLTKGALVFKHFQSTTDDLDSILKTLCDQEHLHTSYKGGMATRKKVGAFYFESTRMPANGGITQHHEMAYLPKYPQYVMFYCKTPAEHGGNTPICSAKSVRSYLKKTNTFDMFKDRGVKYIRNFSSKTSSTVFPTWKASFEVSTTLEAEEKCRNMDLSFEWVDNGLRTKNSIEAVRAHSMTGEDIFFNHAMTVSTFSSISGRMSPALKCVKSMVGTEEANYISQLPFEANPYGVAFADNEEPISLEILEEISDAYHAGKTLFNWEKGDLLIIDNMLASHGRDPYTGEREVFVGMSDKIGSA